MHGEDEDLNVRDFLLYEAGSFYAIHLWQSDIHEHKFGLKLHCFFHPLFPTCCLTYHLDIGLSLEQCPYACPNNPVVVHYQDAEFTHLSLLPGVFGLVVDGF
jgi:hypothetical protein